MNTPIEFIRRVGPSPACMSTVGCPDIFELQSGDFAVIGIDITDKTAHKLPPTAGCGPDERIVFIPRALLVRAKTDIPDR